MANRIERYQILGLTDGVLITTYDERTNNLIKAIKAIIEAQKVADEVALIIRGKHSWRKYQIKGTIMENWYS